jgi:hypothetical protein
MNTTHAFLVAYMALSTPQGKKLTFKGTNSHSLARVAPPAYSCAKIRIQAVCCYSSKETEIISSKSGKQVLKLWVDKEGGSPGVQAFEAFFLFKTRYLPMLI